jgi:acyl carrier protein
MSGPSIHQRIRVLLDERLAAMGLAPTDVGDSMSLTQSGVLDSFALMELLARIEGELGVQLDLDALAVEEFTTVRGLVRAFEKAGAA